MKVRKMLLTDIQCVQQMYVELQNLHAEHHPDIFQFNAMRPFSYFEEIVCNPNKIIIVATYQDSIVGFIKGKVIQDRPSEIRKTTQYGYIDAVFIKDNFRHMGFGKKLQEAIVVWFKEKGIVRVESCVWEFNDNAKMFYEALGYKYRKHNIVFNIGE